MPDLSSAHYGAESVLNLITLFGVPVLCLLVCPSHLLDLTSLLRPRCYIICKQHKLAGCVNSCFV